MPTLPASLPVLTVMAIVPLAGALLVFFALVAIVDALRAEE